MRAAWAVLVAAVLTACAGSTVNRSASSSEAQHRITIVEADSSSMRTAYIIDADTESCFFFVGYSGSPSLAPVSCEKLAAHVPEAAAHITWLGAPPAAPPPAAPPPAPDKPAP